MSNKKASALKYNMVRWEDMAYREDMIRDPAKWDKIRAYAKGSRRYNRGGRISPAILMALIGATML